MADTPKSFIEHLSELRQRIIYTLIAAVVGISVGMYFSEAIFRFIVKDAGELVQLTYGETFMAQFRIGIVAGLVIALPVVLYQVAAFVLPALTRTERIMLWVLLPGMVVLFVMGWLFGWFVVIPVTRKFLETFAMDSGVQTIMTPTNYINFVMSVNNPLGVVFELPLVVLVLAKIGLVTSRFLRRFWKYALLLIFVAAAVLSPPTIIDQILLAIPMLVLYEFSIWLAKLVEKKRDS